MPTVKLSLSIGFANASRENEEVIDDELWDSMDEKEREEYLDELATFWANNYIDIGVKIVE